MQFLSEPGGGSDVAGAQTTAVRDGDEWMLNGSKIWTTGAWWSDWGLCLARTNWDVQKHRGLTVFMFPIHQGIEVHRIEMLNGSQEFCQEFLTDVRVPDSDRIGEVDGGWTVGTRWMFHERMLYNSRYVTVSGRRQAHLGGRHSAPLVACSRRRRPGRRDGSMTPGARPRRRGPGCSKSLAEAHCSNALGRRGSCGHRRPVRTRAAAIGRLFIGVSSARTRTIGFEIAGVGRPGRGPTKTGRSSAEVRHRLPDAPGVLHRGWHHRDGAQRDQRAGARHAPRAQCRPKTSPSVTCAAGSQVR